MMTLPQVCHIFMPYLFPLCKSNQTEDTKFFTISLGPADFDMGGMDFSVSTFCLCVCFDPA